MSTDLATTGGNVPALANTPASDGIDGRDIALPRLYKGEQQADLVQEGVVPHGSIYVASGPDDPDPEVLVKDATKEGTKGVLVHVLDARKGLNYRDPITKEFSSWAWGDPRAHHDAKKCYHYVVALPEVDPDVPVKLTLASTSRRVGDRINFQLMKHNGPAHELAFRLLLKKRSREDGGSTQRWLVWVEALEEAKPANVEIAAKLLSLAAAASQRNDIETTAGPAADQPAI